MPRVTKSKTNTETKKPASSSRFSLKTIQIREFYTPFLVLLLVVASYFLGVLTTKVQYIQGNGSLGTTVQGTQTGNNTVPTPPPAVVDVKVGTLPLLGNENAKVTIVEFSDLQCPFCRRWFVETYPQIKKDYIDTGKVNLSFRHYPLSFHPAAQKSAEAAECANDQGMFWEFHDKVYEEQEAQGQGTIQYTDADLKQWALDLGLNGEEFNSCLDSAKYAKRVTDDFNDGAAAGVDGTPGFFINGQRIIGAQPYATFKAIIDQELAK